MSEHQAKAKAVAASNGTPPSGGAPTPTLVPLNDTLVQRLARLYWQWQGATQAAAQALANAQSHLDAYVEGLRGAVDALGLDVEVTMPNADGQPGQRIQVQVDFRRHGLVLPPAATAPTNPPQGAPT